MGTYTSLHIEFVSITVVLYYRAYVSLLHVINPWNPTKIL